MIQRRLGVYLRMRNSNHIFCLFRTVGVKMAEKEDLMCSVCLEEFEEPKVLPCCHTFCKGCLERVLEKSGQKTNLVCPQCRAYIQFQWVGQTRSWPTSPFYRPSEYAALQPKVSLVACVAIRTSHQYRFVKNVRSICANTAMVHTSE